VGFPIGGSSGGLSSIGCGISVSSIAPRVAAKCIAALPAASQKSGVESVVALTSIILRSEKSDVRNVALCARTSLMSVIIPGISLFRKGMVTRVPGAIGSAVKYDSSSLAIPLAIGITDATYIWTV